MALSKQGNEDALRQLTSAKSVKEDAELLMAPYLNYESFLIPAPISICVLGRFVPTCRIFTLDFSYQNSDISILYEF